MTVRRRRTLARYLLGLAGVTPDERRMTWGRWQSVRKQLAEIAHRAQQAGIAPTVLASADGRDALAALAALPPAQAPLKRPRMDAEWHYILVLAEDVANGRGLPEATLVAAAARLLAREDP